MKREYLIGICLLINSLLTTGQSMVDQSMNSAERKWVDSVFNSLSLDEQIAQLIHIRAHSNKDAAYVDTLVAHVKKYQVGGATFFQGGPGREAIITNRLQEVSKVPLMISMDAEWGLGMRLDSTMSFPFQMTLGAIQDDDLIYRMGREIARQCRELGIHVNFAPSVDVNNNAANPVINFRSFGENKYNVADKGSAYMRGLQDENVLATAKHFPGHGDTGTDSHYELPVIGHSWERIDSLELYPFKRLIEDGVAGFMIAHLSIPALDDTPNQPSTLSKPIVTSLLRDSLEFQGMTFTDALEMQAVAKYYEPGDVEKEAFKAGNDAMLLPLKIELSIKSIKNALKTGEIERSDLDSRIKRALLMKYRLGLNNYQPVKVEDLHNRLHTGEADLLLRDLYKASITVVQDADSLLPIKNLAATKIASVSLGKGTLTHFQETLGLYSKISHFQVNADAGAEATDQLLSELSEFDLVIVGLHDNSRYPRNKKIYSEEVLQFYSSLAKGEAPVVSVLFRNPYNLSHMPSMDDTEALVVAYQDSWYSQHYAAQAIFGAFAANGKLPVSVEGVAGEGSGVVREGLGRLEYTIPEAVGIDSHWLYAQVDSIVGLGLDSLAYPGGQILMAKHGKVILHKSFGYQTYDREHEVELSDLYDFASITKITGPLPALMKLHDEDKFILEATIGDYLPDYSWGNKKKLDFRNILAHQSPMIPYILHWKESMKKNGKFKGKTFSSDSSEIYSVRLGDNLFMNKDYRKVVYKNIKKSDLRDEQTYLYSGLSFLLYPEIVEQLSGQTYEQYLKSNFYEPLGAFSLTYNPLRFYPKDQIAPTEYDSAFRKQQIQGLVHDEASAVLGGVSGNAGLFGNANDLAKLMEMYRRMGDYGGEQFITYPTMRKFTSCQYCESGNRRGLGFDRVNFTNPIIGFPSQYASLDSFGHSGFTGTFTWADPDNGSLLVFLSNRVYPTRTNRKVYELDVYESLHGLFYQE